jgi:hypothetical protein
VKTFKSLVVVKEPVGVVWATVRDRLTELVPLIEDVAAIEVLQREELGPDLVRIVNRWSAVQRIPELMARSLPSSEISWIDRNEWDGPSFVCRWSVEPSILREHIECRGTTSYQAAMGGAGTRVTFDGTFDLAKGALGGLANALERPMAAFVESIVTTIVPKNSRKVIEAAATLVGREAGA